MAAGLALLGVFALAERRAHGTPLIAPSLLRNRAYTSGLVVGLAFFAGFAGLVHGAVAVPPARAALLAASTRA